MVDVADPLRPRSNVMALALIALFILVPLVLLVWDLPQRASTYSAADTEPSAPRAVGTAIRVHA
jgi:ABC-type sulfate transport system permease component